jgi:hypothetical protein
MLSVENTEEPPGTSRQFPLRERRKLTARIENTDQVRAIAGPGELREQVLLS